MIGQCNATAGWTRTRRRSTLLLLDVSGERLRHRPEQRHGRSERFNDAAWPKTRPDHRRDSCRVCRDSRRTRGEDVGPSRRRGCRIAEISGATKKAFVYDVTAPHDQLKLAAKLNSEHGWQLTEADKESTAKSLYAYGCSYEDIADTLSVGKKRVSEWLSRVVKDNKEKRDRKIFDMWLACSTQQEIAEACDISQPQLAEVLKNIGTVFKNQSDKSLADHATDFDPPIYNIWKQQTKSEGSSHFGNSETRWVDNLLYLYTSPFDVVVDPFAGGGVDANRI